MQQKHCERNSSKRLFNEILIHDIPAVELHIEIKKAPASDLKTGACNAYRLIFYFSFSTAGLAMDSLISVSALMFCIL